MSTNALIDADTLLATAGSRRTELVRGELHDMSPVSRYHSRTVIKLGRQLESFVDQRRLGEVHTEYGFILSRNPDTVRAPDVAFVASARLATARATGFFDGAPDLAVEVLSPDDRAAEVHRKVREYLSAGSAEVWVVDPEGKTLTVHLPSGDAKTFVAPAVVTAGAILPGFTLDLDPLFTF